MNRKNLLERAENPEDKITVARSLDKMHSVMKFAGVEVTDFYDPHRQKLLSGFGLRAGNVRFRNLSHRDFLGAILSLGIKREKMGI
ncbi:YlmH/Sll1252 family protein [Phosphitispora sp. TUW77]